MSTAVFQQTIHDGVIRLPKDAQAKFAGTVNVIVWQTDDASTGEASPSKPRLMNLIRNPVRVAGFKPLSREECHER